MYILRPFMDEVSSEEIVKKDNEMGGNIPGGNFLGGSFSGGNFPRTDIATWFKNNCNTHIAQYLTR